MKTVAITGASGFVGQYLTNIFRGNGYEVVAIKREYLQNPDQLKKILESANIIVNLAGANIINRWSDSYKKLLYSSRIDTTKAIVDTIAKLDNKPELLISTSAVGIYSNKKEYNEENIEYADDFLSKLCQDWESEALKAKEFGVRVAIFRFGIVMGKNGGALDKMLLPFKLGLGGTIGDGSQAFSYIHIKDLAQAYMFVINNQDQDGAYNLTAPNPTTNYGMTKALGTTLNRPTFLPVPTFVLNLIFGEGARVLTDGQRVVPKKLLDAGFEFKFSTIEETLDDIIV